MSTKKSAEPNGRGLGALAIVAAGAAIASTASWLYFHPKYARQRKELKGWMVKAKGEVLEKLESLPNIDEDAYRKVVDKVTARYRAMRKDAPEELDAFLDELNEQWNHIAKHAKTRMREAGKAAANGLDTAVKTGAAKAGKAASRAKRTTK